MTEKVRTQIEMIEAIREVAAHNVAVSQQILQLALQVNALRDRILLPDGQRIWPIPYRRSN